MTESERIVDLFLVKLVKDTKESLMEKEKQKAAKYGRSWNGNSRLWGTIKGKRITEENNSTYQFIMEDYYHWVDEGRNPGNVSKAGGLKIESWIKRNNLNPVRIIEEMKQKQRERLGIKKRATTKPVSFLNATKQLGYIIKMKIQTKGYTGNQFYSEVINDGRLDKLYKDYKEASGKDLVIEFKKSLS